jgi:hypothetical protein
MERSVPGVDNSFRGPIVLYFPVSYGQERLYALLLRLPQSGLSASEMTSGLGHQGYSAFGTDHRRATFPSA